MKPKKYSWLKIALGILVGIILIPGGFALTHSGIGVDRNDLPKFIQADFIELDKIYSISQFRSGMGHDFSGGGETCRSMKHYFVPQYDPTAAGGGRVFDGKELPPLPDGKTDTAIYSPVDGKVTQISSEVTPIGKQIHIAPDNAPQFNIRLFHVYPVEGLKAGIMGLGGSHVKAGEKIGVIAKSQETDISVQIGRMPWNQEFVSYFEVMPDSVFKGYQNRGAASRSDFIISKEYRDAHPLKCSGGHNGESFEPQEGYDSTTEEVHLSGYVVPEYKKDGGQSGTKNNGSNNNQNNECSKNIPADQRPPGCS